MKQDWELAGAVLIGVGVSLGIGYFTNLPPIPTVVEMQQSAVTITTDEGTCTGWVKKGTHRVVTAAHCVPDSNTVNVDFGDGIQHRFQAKYKGDANNATAHDVATFTTEDANIKWPVGLSSCTFKPYVGENLAAIGDALALGTAVTFGQVGKTLIDFHEKSGYKYDNDYIGYTGNLYHGMSGGPVVDVKAGCVMGIVEGGVGASEGTSYSVVTPITDLESVDEQGS